MTRLALLRHGHTPWNRAGRIQGRSDIALDDAARTELAGFQLPQEWREASLWSSPLARAVETAELVGARAPQVAAALTEMHWGDWEGLRGADLRGDAGSAFQDIEAWGWDYRPPGGETPREVLARVLPWVDALAGDTVAVCHIGVMRVLLAHATGWDFNGAAPFAVKRGRLYVIERAGAGWRMLPDAVRLERRDGCG